MNCVLFDIIRWLRHPAFLATWSSLVVLGGVMSWLNPEPAMPFFAPLFAVFMAAGDTAEGLRRGSWDFLLSRGPSVQRWLGARFALAVAASAILLAAHLGAGVASGATSGGQALAWLTTLVYWAGVGVLVGFWLSGAAAVTLALCGTALSIWWVLSGCLWLTGLPARELPWVSHGIVALLAGWPGIELSSRLGPTTWAWEAFHLLAGLAMLAFATWHGSRRPLLARETA